jgi:putative transcriptional regulator
MLTAHATPEILAGFAAGALSEGMSLLVASHLTYCPECRGRVAWLEALGGAVLRAGPEAELSAGCLAGALARIDAGEGAAAAAAARPVDRDGLLPAPLRARLGADAGDIRWRFLLPGLSEHRLEGFAGEEVRLLRARPGVRILQHTHVGEEATLVLAGEMQDGPRVYARGDVALADASDDHRPQIVGSETCVCLVVLSGPMRFTGPVGRALNLFQG